ncbi:helix-turn-helix domain-containing protein [Adlercreutzia sp.]|uniref:helix-turn-helix domain-containing protein n=1 Tax=Adlercreutzia sp. TaxID=1872387 RepID=UPI003AF0CC3A
MNVEIAERLAARRKLAGLSQEALAEKLGVSRQAVSKWERSESSPDTDNLIALAKLYGVSLDELLYVDESIEDDVAFEAADRAEARGAGASVVVAEGAAPPEAAEVCEGAGGGGGSDADADAAANAGAAGAGAAGVGGAEGIDFEKEGRGKVHFGPGGIHVDDGKDHVHVSWAEGVHVVDRHGEEVHVGWDGVRVNTTDPETAEHIFTRDNPFGVSPGGFDAERAKKWLKFPFWALVIVAYLAFGMLSGIWGPTLFLLFLIPVYYIVGAAVASHRIAPMLCALYPIGSIAWFLWMTFVDVHWHGPAWVIFLTIPLVEVIIVQLSKWWNGRKSGTFKNSAI